MYNLNDFTNITCVANWKTYAKRFPLEMKNIYSHMTPLYDKIRKLEYDSDGWTLVTIYQGDQIKLEYKMDKRTGNLIFRSQGPINASPDDVLYALYDPL